MRARDCCGMREMAHCEDGLEASVGRSERMSWDINPDSNQGDTVHTVIYQNVSYQKERPGLNFNSLISSLSFQTAVFRLSFQCNKERVSIIAFALRVLPESFQYSLA